jgi:hypothetical protein
MPAVSPEHLHLALIVAAGVALVLLLRQGLRAWIRRRRILGRIVAAQKGESRARALLESDGYAVVKSQSGASYTLSIDGEHLTVPLRADYLVERAGRRYVAEVKTGAYAPHLRTPATRRQLLEYRIAFDVDGVLLVDAEKQRVHIVQFPLPYRQHVALLSPLSWIAIGVGIAALIASQWR